MAPTRASTGLYGGKTAEQRRDERRTRLLEAGAAIWIADGWAAVSMRAVCSRAGLTDRYFYAEFSNVHDLLAALWDQANERALAVVVADFATHEDETPRDRLRSGIATYISHLATHPDDARILFGDSAGCAVLTSRQRDLRLTGVAVVADFGEPFLAAGIDHDDFLVRVRMAIGGLLELLAAWQAGDIPGTVDEIVAHATTFCELLAASVT
ncbi:transcriptional regulator, TetR family [Aeromicrobium marinum DSM 15272]|uniref:Transcriptional regulator, TetR family n=1 Tax=Aeromicrobium marinum DSM 15272 TaxID=585531 RepID=E2SCD7_9ACTN|nr:TetR family transcriptional regulator [Aeromicrobium marinum]EFQ82890.1 transcriptional regulator, TetR family [Aeromicrobium marinum DSM 15272]